MSKYVLRIDGLYTSNDDGTDIDTATRFDTREEAERANQRGLELYLMVCEMLDADPIDCPVEIIEVAQ